jgi:hypothetical protein
MRHGSGVFINSAIAHLQAMIEGSVALPWEMSEFIFLRYKWRIKRVLGEAAVQKV